MEKITYNGRMIPVKHYLISTEEFPSHTIIDNVGKFNICRETETGELFAYMAHKPIIYDDAEDNT